MKTMKKIASLLLALAMIFALATTAFANTIEVTEAVPNESYTIFKMLDLTVDDEDTPTAFSYTLNETWSGFFTSGAGKDYVNIENNHVTWKNDKDDPDDMIRFGQHAKAYAVDQNLTGTTKTAGTDKKVVFDNLDDGYYLITSTLGTQVIVGSTPTAQNITIEEKNPEDTITKEVQEDNGGAWGKSNDAQIGDTVYFKSTATLYPYTTNVKIYDTMDNGLTYTAGSVEIADLTKGTEYTVEENKTVENVRYDFVITFTEAYLASLDQTTQLNLTYNAVLNENAVRKNDNGVVIVDQKNETKITYGDKQSVEDQTTTTTHKFSVFKHAKDSKDNLPGAVFSLKKNGTVVPLINLDDNNYRVAKAGETGTTNTFTTVANGDIVIWGVDSDADYTLLETEAPEGYNKLTAEVTVTVNADNSTRIDVENNSGTELPSTGGMGTTLFYVLGGILVAVAVVLLVTKKRMASNN